jgi:hypothetical protein
LIRGYPGAGCNQNRMEGKRTCGGELARAVEHLNTIWAGNSNTVSAKGKEWDNPARETQHFGLTDA